MKSVIFHPAAESELENSRRFYEASLGGLGVRFLDQVEATIDRIRLHPKAGTDIGSNLRKRVVPGFPYNLIYKILPDRIYLVSVAHQQRRPGYWKRRIGGV